jgi:hypothetical protein
MTKQTLCAAHPTEMFHDEMKHLLQEASDANVVCLNPRGTTLSV